MNIYIGNLNYRVKESDLYDLLGKFGNVTSAKIITDRDTKRSKGFGFVEMENASDAESAIEALNGTELLGRSLVVKEALPRD